MDTTRNISQRGINIDFKAKKTPKASKVADTAYGHRTLLDILASKVSKPSEQPKFWEKGANGEWASISFEDYWNRIQDLAYAFKKIGIRKGDYFLVIAENSLEWEIIEKAAQFAGAVVFGVEPHAKLSHVDSLISRVKPKAAFVQSVQVHARLMPALSKHVQLLFTPHGGAESISTKSLTAEFARPAQTVMRAPSATDGAVLVFSSGTTGQPKGIIYSHAKLLLACNAIFDNFRDQANDVVVASWLPLAHLFQRVVNNWTQLANGEIYYVRNPLDIASELPSIKPTAFIGVPKFLDKLYEQIQQGLVKKLGQSQAKRLLSKVSEIGEARAKNQKLTVGQKVWKNILDRILFGKVKSALGGQLKVLISGSAPASHETLYFFAAMGLPILEAYGVSENLVPMCLNTLEHSKVGSVGRPLAQNEIKISETGEILVRGPGVFSGYVFTSSSKSALDKEGYYHTGDIGFLDEEGYLFLRGRQSDFIKLSSGRKVVTGPLERRLEKIAGVSSAIISGHGRSHLVAVLALNAEVSNEEFLRIEALLSDFNQNVKPYERIRGVAILCRPLEVQKEELTMNFKVRRAFILDKWFRVTEEIYKQVAVSESEIVIKKIDEREPAVKFSKSHSSELGGVR